MKTIAFVGKSGTGKSFRATMVSKKYGADAIIDDGILVSHGKLIAGSSAKKQPTKIESVKQALFMNDAHAEEVKTAIKNSNIKCLMILGTSDRMVNKIADRLEVSPIEQIIWIEDIATPEEMAKAKFMRETQGKHVIPVPTLEIKEDFSGFFLHPLKLFRKDVDNSDDIEADKSIVRPTYSYMGDYIISDNVIKSMIKHEAEKFDGVKVININIRKTNHGIHVDISVSLKYGIDILKTGKQIQKLIIKNIENITSVNVRRVHVLVKKIIV